MDSLQTVNVLPMTLSVVNHIETCASTLSNGSTSISNWPFQWKMNFIPTLYKPALEVLFIEN